MIAVIEWSGFCRAARQGSRTGRWLVSRAQLWRRVVVHGVNGGAARAGYTAVYQRPALASIVGEEDFEVVGASQVVLLATCQRGGMRQMSAGDVDRWPCHRSSRTGAHVAV